MADSAVENSKSTTSKLGQNSRQPRYFERPEEGERPLGFFRLLLIVMSTHLGVTTRQQREEDFRRANGLHVFVAGVIYFLLLIAAIIVLINVVLLN